MASLSLRAPIHIPVTSFRCLMLHVILCCTFFLPKTDALLNCTDNICDSDTIRNDIDVASQEMLNNSFRVYPMENETACIGREQMICCGLRALRSFAVSITVMVNINSSDSCQCNSSDTLNNEGIEEVCLVIDAVRVTSDFNQMEFSCIATLMPGSQIRSPFVTIDAIDCSTPSGPLTTPNTNHLPTMEHTSTGDVFTSEATLKTDVTATTTDDHDDNRDLIIGVTIGVLIVAGVVATVIAIGVFYCIRKILLQLENALRFICG